MYLLYVCNEIIPATRHVEQLHYNSACKTDTHTTTHAIIRYIGTFAPSMK